MTQDFIRALNEKGYRARVVKIERLSELRTEIETRRAEGLISEAFFDKWLAGFVFAPPESLPDARSLIVVAVGQPHVRFIFTVNGKRVPLVVPPTYIHSAETDKQAGDDLAEILAPEGYRVVRAAVPKKLLAVRSGLAVYGKNNITYVDGTGSFHQLVTCYSDLPCEQDEWREPKMMERCQECFACLHNCPTGAITAERFLVYAEKCITFYNEEPGDVPFPAWLSPSSHDLLVGCLRCQQVCPTNMDIKEWVEDGAEFTADETNLLLGGTPPDRLPREMVKKMEESGFIEIIGVLPRNLKVLLERTES